MSYINKGKKRLTAAVTALLFAGAVHAQSTVSSIYGQAPAEPGLTVSIRSTSTGLTREVPVDGNGRYNIPQLPIGSYTVTLKRNGETVQSRDNVALRVGVAENVSFTSDVKQLEGVTVTAAHVPSIDVTSVDSRTVVTAAQLNKLPLPRSAEAAALLAPGVTGGATSATGRFGAPLVSFGGAAVVENQYYVNGFNTTDPNQGQGGLTMPYGAIDQEEVYTGGYSAQYGRSNGGVLNIIGRSGSNDWKFGGALRWEPQSWRSSADDVYYTHTPTNVGPAGDLYKPLSENRSANFTYDAYLGGPIIQDKLFFFIAGENSKTDGRDVGNVNSDTLTDYTWDNPKLYAKINWNITDNHLLELTGDYNELKKKGTQYHYDFAARQKGAFKGFSDDETTGGHFWSAKYTGYLTDALTLSVQYGQMKLKTESLPVGLDTVNPFIQFPNNQNPALNGGVPNVGIQTRDAISKTDYTTKALRAGLNWVLGDHSINVGIDNLNSQAINIGASLPTGPGYLWSYGFTAEPTVPLLPEVGVGAPADFPNGAGGYYVTQNIRRTGGNLYTYQRAEYLEDNWQVSERLLLSLGLRHDSYDNKNAHRDRYIKQSNLWQPRLGFSWDVNGDSSFKVFGNFGRYAMNQPLATDAWLANTALNTQQYFTYSGIAGNGEPTGLTQMSVPVSINGSYGQSPDPRQVYAKGLKPQEQDEFILGFVKAFNENWTYGAKFTRRELLHVIDDYCDTDRVVEQAIAMGIDPDVGDGQCWQINGGEANTFSILDTAGTYHNVRLSRQDMGFPELKRKYNGVNLFLEHRFDGRWYGKLDYTWSRSYGNSEGQSQTRTDSVGGTQQTDWDNPAVMVYSNGPQGNDHTHQFKLFGYYQFTPEWQVGANLSMISGGPKYCLGKYGPDLTTPYGYSSFYWCNGEPSPPGKQGRMPWRNLLDLGVHYRPTFADNKLAFHLDVFNVFNRQVPLNEYWRYRPDRPNDVWPLYRTPTNSQAPRSARITISYDY